jgi:hypothetical protein
LGSIAAGAAQLGEELLLRTQWEGLSLSNGQTDHNSVEPPETTRRSSTARLSTNLINHDSHRYYLAHAFAAGETFLTAINMLENSSERTSAKARTEEAIAYVMKLLEEYDANTPRGTY